ncbi:unnamed protein product, partial [Iphiclides podalirius]
MRARGLSCIRTRHKSPRGLSELRRHRHFAGEKPDARNGRGFDAARLRDRRVPERPSAVSSAAPKVAVTTHCSRSKVPLGVLDDTPAHRVARGPHVRPHLIKSIDTPSLKRYVTNAIALLYRRVDRLNGSAYFTTASARTKWAPSF